MTRWLEPPRCRGKTPSTLALYDPVEQAHEDMARARQRLEENSELLRAANRLDREAGLDEQVPQPVQQD